MLLFAVNIRLSVIFSYLFVYKRRKATQSRAMIIIDELCDIAYVARTGSQILLQINVRMRMQPLSALEFLLF